MSKEHASISTMLHFRVFGLRFYHKKDILEENLVLHFSYKKMSLLGSLEPEKYIYDKL